MVSSENLRKQVEKEVTETAKREGIDRQTVWRRWAELLFWIDSDWE